MWSFYQSTYIFFKIKLWSGDHFSNQEYPKQINIHLKIDYMKLNFQTTLYQDSLITN